MKAPKKGPVTGNGLGEEIAMPKLVPALQPSDLGRGCLVKYMGSEMRQSKEFGRDQRLHMFALGRDHEYKQFALWGASQLDLKLRTIPKASVLVLQYKGKPEGERTMHQWSVRPFRGTSEQLLALADEFREGNEDAAGAVAILEDQMAANAGGELSHEADALPF